MLDVGLAVDQRTTAVRTIQTEQQSHRGRLPGSIRSQEPGDDTRSYHEAQVVDRDLRPVVFGETGRLDHGAHLEPVPRHWVMGVTVAATEDGGSRALSDTT